MFSVFLDSGSDKKDDVLAVVTAAAWEPGNLSPPPSLNHFLLRS